MLERKPWKPICVIVGALAVVSVLSADHAFGQLDGGFISVSDSASYTANRSYSGGGNAGGDSYGCGDSCGADCGCGGGCGCGCGDACGCDYGCESGCGCCEGPWTHRTSVFAEFLYLHPTGIDMAHAQQQNGIGGAGTVPFGRIGTLDPDYSEGGRIGFIYALDGCSSVAVTYTHFESNTYDTVVPPNIPGGGGAVGSLVHHPATVLIASPGPVDAAYGIDFQIIDVDYRALATSCDCYWVNYSLGVRFAHLDQDFIQIGNFGGGTAGAIATGSSINFDGAGVKLGVDGERMIGRRGFSVYGKASLSPMVGQFGSRYAMVNTVGNVLLADAYWKDDRFVTMLEYELGVAWTSCNERWRFSAGYMASFWYNAVTTPEFVQAVQMTDYVDLGDTISFDGLVARAEFRW